jgi:hypothetical protein
MAGRTNQIAVPVSEDVEPAMNGPRGYQLKVANVGFGESPPTASGRVRPVSAAFNCTVNLCKQSWFANSYS